MNDKQIDELISKALLREKDLPEGLSERLELYIDQLASDGQKAKKHAFVHKNKQAFYWISGIVAAMFIGIALFFQIESYQKPTITDTFSSPEEAAVVAQDLLVFMSQQLNNGLVPIDEARKEIEKINEILKQLND